MTEWRTLPEFPKYEITDDGDVRNRETRKMLNETQNKRTGAWSYCLRFNNGKNTHRSCWSLIYSAWPELKPAEPEKPEPVASTRSYVKRGLWTVIPDYPTYQLHPDGIVRYTVSKRFRKTELRNEVEMVLLHNEDGSTWRSINGLLFEVFNSAKDEAA
jgi:hypothetical protein